MLHNNTPEEFAEVKNEDASVTLHNPSNRRYTLFTKSSPRQEFPICALISFKFMRYASGLSRSEYWQKEIVKSLGIYPQTIPTEADRGKYPEDELEIMRLMIKAAEFSPDNWLGNFLDPNYKVPKAVLKSLSDIAAVSNNANNDTPSIVNTPQYIIVNDFLDGFQHLFPPTNITDLYHVARHVITTFMALQKRIHTSKLLQNIMFIEALLESLIRSPRYKTFIAYHKDAPYLQGANKNIEKLMSLGADPYLYFRICYETLPFHTFQHAIKLLPVKTPAILMQILYRNSFHFTSKTEWLRYLKPLQAAGLDINFTSLLGSFLHDAMAYENPNAPLLIEAMNEEKITFNINARDFALRTPLILAARMLQTPMVKSILHFHTGIEVNPVDKRERETCIYNVYKMPKPWNPEKATPLAINAQDEYGRTALHYAMAFGLDEMVEMLILHGANTRLRAADEYNAFEFSIALTNEELIDLLVEVFLHPFRDKDATANAMRPPSESLSSWSDKEGAVYLQTQKNYHDHKNAILESIISDMNEAQSPIKAVSIEACQKQQRTFPDEETAHKLKELQSDQLNKKQIDRLKQSINNHASRLSGISLFDECRARRGQFILAKLESQQSHHRVKTTAVPSTQNEETFQPTAPRRWF